jgi:hypothetical protein
MVALAIAVCARPAAAQTAATPAESTRPVEFIPRTAFHMTAEHLSGDDPRYVWDANFGGELDIVDYGLGRFTFEGNWWFSARDRSIESGNYIWGRSSV